MKCDETKPHCSRCSEKGVACPGYAKDFRWSDKYELRNSQATTRQSDGMSTLELYAEGQNYTMDPSEMFLMNVPTDLELLEADTSMNFSDRTEPTLWSGDWLQDPTLPVRAFQEASGDVFVDDTDVTIFEPLSLSDPCHSLVGLEEQQFDIPIHSASSRAIRPEIALSRSMPSTSEISEDCYEDADDSNDLRRTRTHELVRSDQHVAAGASSQISVDLLKWFYRSSPEQYSDTDLVEHYFGQVCRLYALFDSTKNPFRTLVRTNWDKSGSISLAIQSMACGHLSNRSQTMVAIGRQKQQQAKNSVTEDLQLYHAGKITADRILLAVLLLGTTASWHNESDLGLGYIAIARELVQAKMKQLERGSNGGVPALDQFFFNAVIYWEMLIAFVDRPATVAETSKDSVRSRVQPMILVNSASVISQGISLMPHPWTGVAPHIQTLFAEIGRIIRRRTSGHGLLTTTSEEIWASTIEKSLKATEVPTADIIDNTDDENTPQVHFVQLAEAYKCAGVLQIYHVFPKVLRERMVSELVAGAVMPSSDDMRQYRTALAVRILNLVESMPISSGSSCLHPILILTAGSELRFHEPMHGNDVTDRLANQGIAVARSFAKERLCALVDRLPRRPYQRMLDILLETWLQMDLLGEEVHWMQVMRDNHWETIMG